MGITDSKCIEIRNIKEPVSFALETDASMGDFTINTTFKDKPDHYNKVLLEITGDLHFSKKQPSKE